jgi:hypothetical protein
MTKAAQASSARAFEALFVCSEARAAVTLGAPIGRCCEGFPTPARRWRGPESWGRRWKASRERTRGTFGWGTRRKRYGDFGVVFVMGKLC